MPQTEEKSRSLRNQSTWILAAKIIGFACSFVLPLLIVRYLTQDMVGLYRQSFQVIANAVALLPLGLSMSAYYYLSREQERRSAAVLNILIFNTIVGGLAFLTFYLFPQLLGAIFRSDEMAVLAPRIGIVIWIWTVSTFLETVAIANQEAKAATLFIVFAQFSKTLLMGAAVLYFGTVDAFLYAAMIQGAIQLVILFGYLNSRFPRFWSKFDSGFLREHLRYATPFGLAGMLWMAQNDVHNYFVGHKFSDAEYAVYAYGCFQLPLIAMLAESVTSVLMPRMNQLQIAGEREEMIRLTARGVQKLAFFYFPIYIFLMITAYTFIVTLFTEKYSLSASIFVVNLTLLPVSVLITDPVVRSFKELGRLLLLTRAFVLTCLIGTLYFGLEYFDMRTIIIVAVGAILAEKCIAETMILKKLGVGRRHVRYLAPVIKTAAASVAAGIVTYLVYSNSNVFVAESARHFAEHVLAISSANALHFIGGACVLAVSAAVFAPIYLMGANLLGLIEEGEKNMVRNVLRRFLPKRIGALADTRS